MTKISLIDLMVSMAKVYKKEIEQMDLKEYYLARFDSNKYNGKTPQDYYLLKTHDLRIENAALREYYHRKSRSDKQDGLFYICRFENPRNSHDEVNLIFDFSLCLYFFIKGHQDNYLRCCDYEVQRYVGDFVTVQTEGFNIQVCSGIRSKSCQTPEEAIEMAKAYCFCSEIPEVQDLYWNWEQKVKMAPISKCFAGIDGFAIILDRVTGWMFEITDYVKESRMVIGSVCGFNIGVAL